MATAYFKQFNKRKVLNSLHVSIPENGVSREKLEEDDGDLLGFLDEFSGILGETHDAGAALHRFDRLVL